MFFFNKKGKLILLILLILLIIFSIGVFYLISYNSNIELYPNTREDGLLYKHCESASFTERNYGVYIYTDGKVVIHSDKTKEIGYADMSYIKPLQKEIEKLNFRPNFKK